MGNEGPMRANKWLLDLDMTFKIIGCPEEQKVHYSGHLLQRDIGI